MRDSVEQVFIDLPEDGYATIDSEIVLLEDADGKLRMLAADRDIGPRSPDAVFATLVTSVSRLALDSDSSRLHLHCAALSKGATGVLISAPSGTGKTTLAAALTLHGWSYVSDEAVAFDAGSTIAAGFAKPLIIKPGGGVLVPQLEAASVQLASDVDPYWLVPVSALSASIQPELEPTVIVILHRAYGGVTDASPLPTQLHPADAAVALMGQTMDAERFGPHAAATLCHIAARCRCVALPVGPLDALVAVLDDLASMPPERAESRDLHTPIEANSNGWQVVHSVRSTIIGDRVVVHDTLGGTIVALDEAGTALWLALHGEPPGWWQPDMMLSPSTEAFLEQLSSYGLVIRLTAREALGA